MGIIHFVPFKMFVMFLSYENRMDSTLHEEKKEQL